MSYDQVDALCQTDERLGELHRLSTLLRRSRIEKGAMLLPLPEVYAELGEDGKVHIRLSSRTPRPSGSSRSSWSSTTGWRQGSAGIGASPRFTGARPGQANREPGGGGSPLCGPQTERQGEAPLNSPKRPGLIPVSAGRVRTNVTSPHPAATSICSSRGKSGMPSWSMTAPYTSEDLDKRWMALEPC